MKLGIFAKTFNSESIQCLFESAKSHQIKYLQYNMVCSGLPELPKHIPDEVVQEVIACTIDYDLRIIGLSATFNMIDPDPKVRNAGLKSLAAIAKAGQLMGSDFISLCSGSRDPVNKWKWHPENNSPAAWRDLLETLEQAIQITEEYNTVLGIEPETANVVKNPTLARKLLDEVQCSRLKIILDPANLFEQASNSEQVNGLIGQAFDLLHQDIAMAHAKDRKLDGTFMPVGQGDLNFEFYIGLLRQTQFKGPLVMHGLEEKQVAASVKFLKSIM